MTTEEYKKKRREAMRKWRSNPYNAEKNRNISKNYYYRKRNDPVWLEKERERSRIYQLDLLHRNEEYRKRQNEYTRKLGQKYRTQVMEHYGNKCNCCGETINRFLTIDHINNDGYIQRRAKTHKGRGKSYWFDIIKNNFPNDLQILCYNCNCARAVNNGVCPHKEIIGSLTGIK